MGTTTITWHKISQDGLPPKHHNVLFVTQGGQIQEGEFDGFSWTQYRWSAHMGSDSVIAWAEMPVYNLR